MGLMTIDRPTARTLQKHGIEAETIGLQRMANGASMVTFEVNQEIKARLLDKILACDDPEVIAMLTTAMANIQKAEAMTFRALGSISAPPENRQRIGKKFAPTAPNGHIDVKAAS